MRPNTKVESPVPAAFKVSLLSDELWSEIKGEYSPLMPDIQAADSELEVGKQHYKQRGDRRSVHPP